MPTLYNQQDLQQIIDRINSLNPHTQRQWGKMNVGQMLSHCNASLETAMGKNHFRHLFIGKLIGSLMKKSVLGTKTWAKNSPTDKSYIFKSDCDFKESKMKALTSLKEFAENGPAKCTCSPHPFFGHFTAEQWGVFQWKHMDHHLRQFGV